MEQENWYAITLLALTLGTVAGYNLGIQVHTTTIEYPICYQPNNLPLSNITIIEDTLKNSQEWTKNEKNTDEKSTKT